MVFLQYITEMSSLRLLFIHINDDTAPVQKLLTLLLDYFEACLTFHFVFLFPLNTY